MKVIVATRNRHKSREIGAMLKGVAHVLDLEDVKYEGEIEESGKTFEANARIKLHCLCDHLERMGSLEGKAIALADDSGIEVDALNGAPGVFSARYAGEPSNDEANNVKLLQALEKTPEADRLARFRCVLAAATLSRVAPNAQSIEIFVGACPGKITFEPRGENGFGYDPIFLPEGFSRSYAEISDLEKNKISHRAKAMRLFLAWVQKFAAP